MTPPPNVVIVKPQPAPVVAPTQQQNIVTLKRSYTPKETTGLVSAIRHDSQTFNCKSLELPWLQNQHNISCIPAGTYECSIQPFYKLQEYELASVPNRTGIFIHGGNFAAGEKVDTEGCILFGEQFIDINGDGQIDVTNTQEIVLKFKEFFNGENFTLIIS